MKLQGEGRGEELREGASHSLLVKAFTDSHVVGYIRDKRFLVAWQVIARDELVLRLDLVTFMVVKEIITTYYMALQGVT